MTASSGHGPATSASLYPRRLHVAREFDGHPPDAVAVAPVLGRAVHPLAAVLVQHGCEGATAAPAQPLVLVLRCEVTEVGTQRGQPRPVTLLEPHHGSVELAFRDPERSLDARPPRQLIEPVKVWKRRTPPRPRVARGGAAGPDAGRIDGEGAEQAVDVVGHPGLPCAGLLVGGDQPGAGRVGDLVLRLSEEAGHRAI